MYQSDDPSCAVILPTPAAPGTPGFYIDENAPLGVQGAAVRADHLNSMQLELLNLLIAAGIAPSKTVYTQVLASLRAIISASNHGACTMATTGATNVTLKPFQGGGLVVAGVGFQIPAAGVAALTTSTFLNGVAAQALAPSTNYYIYAFNNAGALALDFWTFAAGPHMTDTTAGNIGVEVRSNGGVPDSTRTLVGQCLTDASSHINDTSVLRTLRSWFDRRQKTILGAPQSSTSAASGFVEANVSGRVSASIWAGEAVTLHTGGSLNVNLANGSSSVGIGMDGSSSILTTFGNSITSPNTSANEGGNAWLNNDGVTITEGAHNFNAFFSSDGTHTATLTSLMQGTVGG
jgi:hypothetical protein